MDYATDPTFKGNQKQPLIGSQDTLKFNSSTLKKWWFPQGISSFRAPFLGSMSIFRALPQRNIDGGSPTREFSPRNLSSWRNIKNTEYCLRRSKIKIIRSPELCKTDPRYKGDNIYHLHVDINGLVAQQDTKLNQHELTRSRNKAIVNSTNKISYYVHINSSMIFWVNRKHMSTWTFLGHSWRKQSNGMFFEHDKFSKKNRLTFQKTMTWIYPPRRIQVTIMMTLHF